MAVEDVPSSGGARLPGLDLCLADWEADGFSFSDFDRYAETLAADAAGAPFEIRLSGEAGRLAPAARQVVLRCQRLATRRNAASAGEAFERVLACHRRFRELPCPGAAAGHAHALDTWQWLLRLDPDAGLALQVAALFHEAWRLAAVQAAAADPSARAAGRAGRAGDGSPGPGHEEWQSSLAAAATGAWIADELLADAGVDLATRVRVHRLIAGADPPGPGAPAPDHAMLAEADALSFLSLGCAACLDELGAEAATRRLAGALRQLRPASHAWLCELRLPAAVVRLTLPAPLALPAAIPPMASRSPMAFMPPLSPVAGTELGPPADPAGLAQPAVAGGLSSGVPAAAVQPRAASQRLRGALPSDAAVQPHTAAGSAAAVAAAAARARRRLAAGLAGGAGIAPNRVSALLARAAMLGDLAAHPRARVEAASPLALAPGAGGSRPASAGEAADAPRTRQRVLALAAKPKRVKCPSAAAERPH